MDKNSMGAYHTFFHHNSLCLYLPSNVKIPVNPNDSYRNLYLFRNFLEFLSIRIQMCSYLQNNIDKLLHSCIILRNHRTHLLDHRTSDV
jgi:hypothetical protein